jgi:hypothetical protein
VLKSCDKRAKEMGDYLRERLATTRIQYVSLRSPDLASPACDLETKPRTRTVRMRRHSRAIAEHLTRVRSAIVALTLFGD